MNAFARSVARRSALANAEVFLVSAVLQNSADYHLRDRYGITLAEREEMVFNQGGVCALCEARPATHIDHDHETGKVRAVLCIYCNAALGAFKDDPAIVRRAAEYLRRGDAYA